MSEAEKKPKPPDWLDDDAAGDEAPHWAELPRLEIGDQASASMAIRFPTLPEPERETPALIPPPPGMIVVNDDFAQLTRLRNAFQAPAPPIQAPVADPPSSPKAPVAEAPDSPVRAPIVYGIVVRNGTAEPMHEVRVEHEIPLGPRYIGADPPPRVQGRKLIWEVGAVAPGAKQRFKVTIQPNRPDEIGPDATADFRVYQCLHSHKRILRPAITANVRVPERVSAGDQFTIVVEATNAGPGAAEDVRVLIPLPPGLTHADGQVVHTKRERFGPGERLRFDAEVRAEHGGELAVLAHVFVNNKLIASAQATLNVAGPGPKPPEPVAEPFVVFLLGEDYFALPAGRVREVRRSPAADNASMPLVDLRQRLGRRAEGPAARVLMVGDVGLLVDRTLGVRRLVPQPAEGEYAAASAELAGRRVTVLDLDRLLPAAEHDAERNGKP